MTAQLFALLFVFFYLFYFCYKIFKKYKKAQSQIFPLNAKNFPAENLISAENFVKRQYFLIFMIY